MPVTITHLGTASTIDIADNDTLQVALGAGVSVGDTLVAAVVGRGGSDVTFADDANNTWNWTLYEGTPVHYYFQPVWVRVQVGVVIPVANVLTAGQHVTVDFGSFGGYPDDDEFAVVSVFKVAGSGVQLGQGWTVGYHGPDGYSTDAGHWYGGGSVAYDADIGIAILATCHYPAGEVDHYPNAQAITITGTGTWTQLGSTQTGDATDATVFFGDLSYRGSLQIYHQIAVQDTWAIDGTAVQGYVAQGAEPDPTAPKVPRATWLCCFLSVGPAPPTGDCADIATHTTIGGRLLQARSGSGVVECVRYGDGLPKPAPEDVVQIAAVTACGLDMTGDDAGTVYCGVAEDDGSVRLYRSRDAGATWTLVSTVGSGSNVRIWLDTDTGLLVAALYDDPNDRWMLVVGTLNAAGTTWTWSTPAVLVTGAANGGDWERAEQGGWLFAYSLTGGGNALVYNSNRDPRVGTFA